MPGENFDIEVTFPEDYGNEELNGKDAIFNITINYILNVELTDNIAAEYGFSSVDELLADIEDFIVDGNKFNLLSDLLLEATCSNIPESVLNYVIDSDIAQYSYYSSLYGITVDELIQQLGYESKQAYIDASENDIRIVKSPVGMPGRAIMNTFMERVMGGEKIPHSPCHRCLAKCSPADIPYCITDGLIEAVKGNIEKGLLFCGAKAWKADRIEKVSDVIQALFA